MKIIDDAEIKDNSLVKAKDITAGVVFTGSIVGTNYTGVFIKAYDCFVRLPDGLQFANEVNIRGYRPRKAELHLLKEIE